jgi:hypothetical protein
MALMTSPLVLLVWASTSLAGSASPQASQPDIGGAHRALLLFILLAVVLGAFLLVVIVMVVARRASRRQPASRMRVQTADPWTEAANRVQPYTDDRD